MIHKKQPHRTTIFASLLSIVTLFSISSCDDSTSGNDEPESEIETQTVEDLYAPDEDGTYVFFDLENGIEVPSADSASTEWDIAFSGITVITNSGISGPGSAGAVLLDVSFDGVTMAPSEGYATDTEETLAIPTGNGNGWYNYTGQTGNPQHAVLPIPDKTIAIRTADGNHYAKLNIMSYYQGNPDTSTEQFANFGTRPDDSYYTFEYAIQLEEGLRDLQ